MKRIDPQCQILEIDGRKVITRDTGDMMVLNEVGSFIVHELENGTASDNLACRMVECYETDEKTAETDVREFLAALAEHHIWIEADGTAN